MDTAAQRLTDVADSDPALRGTGTTLVALLVDGTRVGVGHVGDSRAYLLRDGELHQLTHDHTLVQSLIDEGRLTADEAVGPSAPLGPRPHPAGGQPGRARPVHRSRAASATGSSSARTG